MKEITVYEAIDGERFDRKSACRAYELLLGRVLRVTEKLPKESPTGSNYIQCDAEQLRDVKRELFALLVEEYGKTYPIWRELNADDVHPMSYVGRVIDDCGGPLAKAWRMLADYDFSTGRKYSQPYFALQPNEATGEEPRKTSK